MSTGTIFFNFRHKDKNNITEKGNIFGFIVGKERSFNEN
jgi:hypothetical protein